jgi:hypothetical protein
VTLWSGDTAGGRYVRSCLWLELTTISERTRGVNVPRGNRLSVGEVLTQGAPRCIKWGLVIKWVWSRRS